MADLFSVTAPLAIRLPNGEMHCVAEIFKHPKGLLIFWPFWHLQEPEDGIQLIKGWVCGDGPWKISDYVISVLACHHTVACPAEEFEQWRTYLMTHPEEYPPQPMIAAVAKKLGATDPYTEYRQHTE